MQRIVQVRGHATSAITNTSSSSSLGLTLICTDQQPIVYFQWSKWLGAQLSQCSRKQGRVLHV
jgi:hypothetical protein